MKSDIPFRRRLIVIDIMVPTLVIFSLLGRWPFTIFVALVLSFAAWELWRMFHRGGYSPSLPVMLVFVFASAILRYLFEMQYSGLWLAILIMAAMFHHTIMQQQGKKTTAFDFMITVGASVYLGWLGSYAISIRSLPNGYLWLLLIFPIISIADSGGYIFGRLFGKHKMMPLVSPKKSWEGYLGGILLGALGGWGLAALWHIKAAELLPVYGLITGLVISIIAPFGDFGESMIKRQFNLKDTSNLLLEHGGILDRADSSLWAAPIGYYLIHLLTNIQF